MIEFDYYIPPYFIADRSLFRKKIVAPTLNLKFSSWPARYRRDTTSCRVKNPDLQSWLRLNTRLCRMHCAQWTLHDVHYTSHHADLKWCSYRNRCEHMYKMKTAGCSSAVKLPCNLELLSQPAMPRHPQCVWDGCRTLQDGQFTLEERDGWCSPRNLGSSASI